MLDCDLLCSQARALLDGESDWLANAANFASFVYNELPSVNWAGFYFAEPSGELVLGPFMGRPACTRLPSGKGVCGTAFSSGKTLVVADVHAFADHIACDSASESELVVPFSTHGLQGVFDVDAPVKHRFSEHDARCVEELVATFVQALRRSPAAPRRLLR